MSANPVEPGDRLNPGDPVTVDRYTGPARLNHWVTAICLILLALSGLALFEPSLFFLSALFGDGQTMRTLHPWIGVIMAVGFSGLFLRFWKSNLWTAEDGTWLAHLKDVLTGHEEKVPEVGKYNAGQKGVFWAMSVLILVLLASGLASWEQYFGKSVPVELQRIAILVHALAAVAIICVWIVHVYAAIWIRGTMDAMVQGRVTGGWAWRHHRKWLKALASARTRDHNPAKPAE